MSHPARAFFPGVYQPRDRLPGAKNSVFKRWRDRKTVFHDDPTSYSSVSFSPLSCVCGVCTYVCSRVGACGRACTWRPKADVRIPLDGFPTLSGEALPMNPWCFRPVFLMLPVPAPGSRLIVSAPTASQSLPWVYLDDFCSGHCCKPSMASIYLLGITDAASYLG